MIVVNCEFTLMNQIFKDTKYENYCNFVNGIKCTQRNPKAQCTSAYLDDEGDWIGIKNENDFDEMKIFSKEKKKEYVDIQVVEIGERIRQVELVDLKSSEEWSKWIMRKLDEQIENVKEQHFLIEDAEFELFLEDEDSSRTRIENWLNHYPHRRQFVYSLLCREWYYADFLAECFKNIDTLKAIEKELMDGARDPVYKEWVFGKPVNRKQVTTDTAPTKPSDAMNQKLNSTIVHDGIVCDGCEQGPIRGVRYKSFKLMDYDLCLACKRNGKFDSNGPFIELKTEQPCRDKFVHYPIQCDDCLACPIIGPRFASLTIPNYDLCWACEKLDTHKEQGPFIKLYDANDAAELGQFCIMRL